MPPDVKYAARIGARVSARVTLQLAPGKFPEPQQRALNDLAKQTADALLALLDNVTITNLDPMATLPQTVTTVNQILVALRNLGLKL